MEPWMLVVAVLAAVLVAGTVLVALGATWLVHHNPD